MKIYMSGGSGYADGILFNMRVHHLISFFCFYPARKGGPNLMIRVSRIIKWHKKMGVDANYKSPVYASRGEL